MLRTESNQCCITYELYRSSVLGTLLVLFDWLTVYAVCFRESLERLTADALSKVLVYFITKMLAENSCSTNSCQRLRVLNAPFEI